MGSFTGIGKLPSELTEKTSLSETDIVITGSSAQRTTWKNVLEKISFSGLATTAKNIIGAINELNTKNTWKKLGQVTGLGKNISLSGTEEAQEYKCVLIFQATTTGTNLTITIPIMRGNTGTHISGYKYSDNYYGEVGVLYSASNNYMQIVSGWTRIYNSGVVDQSDISMTVYYR